MLANVSPCFNVKQTAGSVQARGGKGNEEWYTRLLRTVVVECLQLDIKIYESVAPLGSLEGKADVSHIVEPLVEQWPLESRVRVVSEILVYQLLRQNEYDARVRASLSKLCGELGVALEVFLEIEAKASDFLTNAEDLKQLLESDQAAQLAKQLAEQDEVDVDKVETQEQTKRDRLRLAKISAAAVTGGILIGTANALCTMWLRIRLNGAMKVLPVD